MEEIIGKDYKKLLIFQFSNKTAYNEHPDILERIIEHGYTIKAAIKTNDMYYPLYVLEKIGGSNYLKMNL